MNPPPIAITGMHRSGTSMITRGLHDAGLHLIGEGDSLIEAAEDNPEGFWENKRIVACNDDLLEATGGAWDTPPPLGPQGVDDPRVTHVADDATEALARLRLHDRWGFKDPRTCLTAPFWMDLEPELVFVICVRHPVEVALSLKRRNQNSYALALALWQQYYETVIAAVPPARRIVTHYDSWFDSPAAELARVCAFADLPAPDPTVRPDLRHHDVAVDLIDAGADRSLIELYAELCTEAGAPVAPTRAPDPTRVRRLILDGAVAQRHAEQRQDAIDRLLERERTVQDELGRLRRETAGFEADMRARLRRVEAQLAEARRTADVTDRLATLEQAARDTSGRLDRLDTTTRHIAARVEVAVNHTRPGPVRRVARRGTRLALRGGRRYAFRPTRIAGQRARRQLRPTARRAVRGLPAPVQQRLRGARRLAHSLRGHLAPASPRDAEVHPPSSDGTPDWFAAFSDLVATHGAQLVVLDVSSASPTDHPVIDVGPDTADLATIARVEKARHDGAQRLAVTEPTRAWLDAHRTVRQHLLGGFATLADQPRAGVVVALDQATADEGRSLRDQLAAIAGPTPSVLDWTGLGLARELDDFTVFEPPDTSHGQLPYLDDSVDVVVVDRNGDRREAARVATLSVVTVEPGPGGHPEVHSIEVQRDLPSATVPSAVVRTAGVALLAGRLSDHHEPSDGPFASLDPQTLPPDVDVVVLVERGVVPLPGALERLVADAAAGEHAVTGKVLTGTGELESAGATVFADRSVGLIGHGSTEVDAPWHEYRRPVCWAAGLLAVSAAVFRAVPTPATTEDRPFLREWCAAAWAAGHRVIYQPAAVAVRVAGDGGEPGAPLHESQWQRVLDLRPRRPPELSDGAWRFVLANDDVDACLP